MNLGGVDGWVEGGWVGLTEGWVGGGGVAGRRGGLDWWGRLWLVS